MAKFCVYCGKPVKPSDKFCINCGKPLLSSLPKTEKKSTDIIVEEPVKEDKIKESELKEKELQETEEETKEVEEEKIIEDKEEKKKEIKPLPDEVKQQIDYYLELNDIRMKKSSLDEKLKNLDMILGHLSDWNTEAEEKQKEFNQLELIRLSYKTYCEKKKEAEKSAKRSEKTKQLLDELEKIRKAKVDEVLNTISTSVERMYTKVHPNEGIGAVKFYLDPKPYLYP